MDGGGQNGQRHDVPWASVFDPAANLRALTTIQAEGFRAASEIVDRVVRWPRSGPTAPNGLRGKLLRCPPSNAPICWVPRTWNR